MKLKEKYSRISDKEEDKIGKIILSDDSYAICDFLNELNNQLELSRIVK
jgi:hypothetical protein